MICYGKRCTSLFGDMCSNAVIGHGWLMLCKFLVAAVSVGKLVCTLPVIVDSNGGESGVIIDWTIKGKCACDGDVIAVMYPCSLVTGMKNGDIFIVSKCSNIEW